MSDINIGNEINKLSKKNKEFQSRFNRVQRIIKQNKRNLNGVPPPLTEDKKLALKCLKEADFDLDKAINAFIVEKAGSPSSSTHVVVAGMTNDRIKSVISGQGEGEEEKAGQRSTGTVTGS